MALTDFGDVPAGSVLPIFFTSHDAATGANETMSALAVADVLIYKGVSLTQRSSTAGFTLLDSDGIDVDTFTGVNAISIDLGDDTDAGFYAVGSFYNVILGPVTIDAQTVYVHLATFRIVLAESVAGEPKVDVGAWLGTAAATPTVAGVPEVDLTHVAGATTNVAALATNVDAILTDTGTTLQAELDAIEAAVITNAAGVDIAADIIAIKAETASILTDTAEIGAAGAGLTALASQASVTAIDDLLDSEMPALTTAVADLPTNAELATALGTADDATLAAIAALNNLSAAQVNTEVDTAIADARLDELLAADSDIDGAAPPTVGSVFHELMSKTAGSFTFDQTTDSHEALRDRGDAAWVTGTTPPTAASVADAVWDELKADHAVADSFGDYLDDEITSRGSQTSVDDLPTNAELATALGTADDAVLAAIAALNNLAQADVRTALGLASANMDTQLDTLPTATENADALLKRDMSAVTGEATRSLLNALRAIRNRVAISGGTMTVYKEDDSTSAYTAVVTTAAGNPISEIDPS